MAKLSGKVALVTGASKGIGASIAEHLAAEGASVVVNYASSREGAEAVVRKIEAAGGKAVAVGGNVAEPAQVQKLVAETVMAFGKIDILVNNAGVYAFAPLETVTPEHFHRHFNTNVLGLLLTTQEAVKHFPAEGGSVINIGSVVSTLAPPAASVYSATKGAVDVITMSLAKELAPRKIRVNSVNPGIVETEGSADFRGTDFEKAAVAATPLARTGKPDDIASVVTFLAGDDAKWLTGELIKATGGAR